MNITSENMYGKRNQNNGLKERYRSHVNRPMGLQYCTHVCTRSRVQERRPYCLYPAGSPQGSLCGSPRSLWCSRCLSWRGDRRTCRKEDASALLPLTSAYHTGDTHSCALVSKQTHRSKHAVRSKTSAHCLSCPNSCVFYIVNFKQWLLTFHISKSFFTNEDFNFYWLN